MAWPAAAAARIRSGTNSRSAIIPAIAARLTASAGRARRTAAACRPASPWHRPAAGPSAAPAARPGRRRSAPLWPRTSSAASGLRLLGMIDEPVDQASGSVTKPNGCDRPEDDFLGQPRQMDRAQRGGVEIIDHEIAVADRVEAVGGRPVEAERRARSRRGRSGSRSRPAPPLPSGHSFIRARASAKRLRSRTSISR